METRIGLSQLLESGNGSVALPSEILMVCPQCSAMVADKGQCLVALEKFTSEETNDRMDVRLVVDCRNCGCYGKAPLVDF